MSRPARSLRAVTVTCLAMGLTCSPSADPPAPRPNLLLVTVDTLRADRLVCYGGPPDVGTGICALTDAGTRFEWAFSTAPSTSPSVGSILTSLYPAEHGFTQHAKSTLKAGNLTLAEILREAGYTTAAFVSNPVLDARRTLAQGFGVYNDEMPRRERNRPGYAERDARDTTDAALAWAQMSPQSPWFLWVHFQDPHGPYEPPRVPRPLDPPDGTPLRQLKNNSGRGGIPNYQALPRTVTAEAYAAAYLDEIRFLDREVKRLVEGLDALGEIPAVLLTADHGEAFGEDGFYFAHGHSVGFDQIRVPLLWRPARRAKPRVERTPVSLLDVAPTLLDAAGIDAPTGMGGRPLPGNGEARSERARAIFAEHGRQAAVILDGEYYSRDRDPAAADSKRWGLKDPALPARRARLGDAGAPTPYEPTPDPGAVGRLERELAAFLEAVEGLPEAPNGDMADVPETMRQRLEALGYTE